MNSADIVKLVKDADFPALLRWDLLCFDQKSEKAYPIQALERFALAVYEAGRATERKEWEKPGPVVQIHPNHFRPTDSGGQWCREVLIYSGDHNGDLLAGKNTRVKLYLHPSPEDQA